MIDLDRATLGCELEMGDVDTRLRIPEGNTWDYRDGSICNSNGTANDPKKEFNKFGGEIQVRPADSPEQLVNYVLDIYDVFQKISSVYLNFTTNLHVHVKVPGLKKNLRVLKRITEYLNVYHRELFQLIDPIPLPYRRDYPSNRAFQGAMKRYKRRQRSHHAWLSEETFQRVMSAKTPEEFFSFHAPGGKGGKPQWHLFLRPGVNLTQMISPSGTIEFRHFTMTKDVWKLWSAFDWTRLFLEATISTHRSPKEILRENPGLKFQEFFPYKYNQDWVFQLTDVRHHSRKQVKENYERLIRKGILTREELGL